MKIKKNDLINTYAQSIGIETARELIADKIKAAALEDRKNYSGEKIVRICRELEKEGGLIRIIAQSLLIQLERRRSEEQTLLLDNIDIQIWYLTDIETYGAVNKTHAEFLGMEKSGLEDRSLYGIIGEKETGHFVAGNREVFEKKIQIQTEETVKNSKGETRLLSITRTPKLDRNENVEYVICAAQDITERKRAEEELAKHRDHLEELVKERTRDLETAQKELIKREKLSVLGQLTATVSHEIRNPLGVIRSSTFYLQRKLGHADKKITKHLNRVEKHVDLCNSIVNELLEYTRGRHSEATQGKINTWLEKVMDEITIPENIALVTEYSPDLPMVHFDRNKMHRVVFNLVNNALHAVTARHDSLNEKQGPYQPQVKVSTSFADNGIHIDVADNGIGMDHKTASQAFEPLFTTSARGTGLGLAIVQKIVEEHNGHISLDSTPNRGTKVTLVIPAGT
ncbi:MAG: ATP-binding protein [Thermodesulfobacteriota bacterium]|nr:ATP-binding protein [Thermodesulfobacteriota bacterium]